MFGSLPEAVATTRGKGRTQVLQTYFTENNNNHLSTLTSLSYRLFVPWPRPPPGELGLTAECHSCAVAGSPVGCWTPVSRILRVHLDDEYEDYLLTL